MYRAACRSYRNYSHEYEMKLWHPINYKSLIVTSPRFKQFQINKSVRVV